MQLNIPHTAQVMSSNVLLLGETVTLRIHDTDITVRSQYNDNGTTTWFISNLIMWFGSKADVEAMLVKFSTQHNWEQDPK